METVTPLNPLAQRSDEELMTLWVAERRRRRGDTRPFDELYARHGAEVRRRIAALMKEHPAHVDDVFQETWMEVTQTEVWTPTSFLGWVLTIATRKALTRLDLADLKKPRAGAKQRGEGGGPPDAVARLVTASAGPEARAIARNLLALVMTALCACPEDQQVAWILRYLEGLSFEEVAARTAAPLGTAKTRVRLATAAVYDDLKARGVDMSGWRRQRGAEAAGSPDG